LQVVDDADLITPFTILAVDLLGLLDLATMATLSSVERLLLLIEVVQISLFITIAILESFFKVHFLV
jgi:hypothetical protein